MWGAYTFGSDAFGSLRSSVVAPAPPTPSSPPIVAHLVGVAEAFAVVGHDIAVVVVGREPVALTLPTMRGPP